MKTTKRTSEQNCPMRKVTTGDLDAQNYKVQVVLRWVLSIVFIGVTLAMLLLVYVFNTSPDHSMTVTGTVIAIAFWGAVVMFGFLLIRDAIRNHFEKKKGELLMKNDTMQ
ncbi:MAG: hypothetical protein ACTJG2_02850 [Candidatus Saccharimonadales bacterium]